MVRFDNPAAATDTHRMGVGKGSTWATLDKRQRHVLTCTLTVNALLFFDQTSVTVALPALHRTFGASTTQLQWVISSYLLALASLMVVAGRVADHLGRRRVFLAGIAVFGTGSAMCALTPNMSFLLAARFVQGIGGAIMQPLALSHTSRAVGEQRRGWAVGLLATGGTTFLTLGPLLGGLIVDLADWRLLFVVNLPFAAFAFRQGRTWIEPSTASDPEPIRPGNVALLVAGLVTAIIGINQLPHWGFGSVTPITLGMILLGVFIARQRYGRHPMIDVTVLRGNRALPAALVALFAIQFAVLGTAVYQTLFLQQGMGERPLVAGAMLALSGICTPLLSITTGRISDRYGPRALVVGGLLLASTGLALLSFLAPKENLALLIPALLLFSLARPAVFTPSSAAAFDGIAPEQRALVGGMVTEARQLGGLMGVAVLGTVMAGVRGTDLEHGVRLADGFAAAMVTTAGVTLIAALIVALTLPRRRRTTAPHAP